MRIRKTTVLFGGEIPETYICHFNQSPWDVIPLTSSDNSDLTNNILNSPSPPRLFQCFHNGEEDSYNENASLGDSNGAAERVNSRSLVPVEGLHLIEELMDLSDNSDNKSKAVESNSPAYTSGDDENVAPVTMRGPPKRGRPRGTAKKAQATTKNPYEFYYYSGFGPRWGRKRGGSGDEKVLMDYTRGNSSEEEEEEEENDDETVTLDRYSNFDEMEYEVVDNEDSEESEDVNEKRMVKMKRCRKPIKERSLKSLM